MRSRFGNRRLLLRDRSDGLNDRCGHGLHLRSRCSNRLNSRRGLSDDITVVKTQNERLLFSFGSCTSSSFCFKPGLQLNSLLRPLFRASNSGSFHLIRKDAGRISLDHEHFIKWQLLEDGLRQRRQPASRVSRPIHGRKVIRHRFLEEQGPGAAQLHKRLMRIRCAAKGNKEELVLFVAPVFKPGAVCLEVEPLQLLHARLSYSESKVKNVILVTLCTQRLQVVMHNGRLLGKPGPIQITA